jgi:membrane protease YdiL (CAAX protease family)
MEAVRARRGRGLGPSGRGGSIGYALGALGVLVAAGIALGLLLDRSELRLGVGVLAIDALMLAALVPVCRTRGFTARALGLRPTAPARAVGLVALAVIAVAAVNAAWLQGVLGLKHPASEGVTLHESTAATILTGFAVAVSGPVVEEIFFRGFLYRAFRSSLAVAPAALLNGVIFGALHGITYPLDTLPPRMAFGVIACLLYEYTGSLYPGIALHCLIDAAAFEAATTGHDGVVLLGFAALGGVVLLYALVRSRRVRSVTKLPETTKGLRQDARYSRIRVEKGKPAVRRGRKARGLTR